MKHGPSAMFNPLASHNTAWRSASPPPENRVAQKQEQDGGVPA
jgi:hypothetical protein